MLPVNIRPGTRLNRASTRRGTRSTARCRGEKSPIIALILSFIFTGLGQFYNGEASKGIVFVLVAILLWIMTILFIFPCIILIPFWIYGMYDAYTRAEQYNRSLRATGRPSW